MVLVLDAVFSMRSLRVRVPQTLRTGAIGKQAVDALLIDPQSMSFLTRARTRRRWRALLLGLIRRIQWIRHEDIGGVRRRVLDGNLTGHLARNGMFVFCEKF
jgi:hypothetical protein